MIFNDVEDNHKKYKELKKENRVYFEELTKRIFQYSLENGVVLVIKDTEDDFRVYIERKDGKRKEIISTYPRAYQTMGDSYIRRDIIIKILGEEKGNISRIETSGVIKLLNIFSLRDLILDFIFRGED